MAARSVESHFRRLQRAKIIDPDQFPRRKDGKLTQGAARRIERLWDRVGPLIANPRFRPFHTYVPRRDKRLRLREAARNTGLDVAGLKGVRGIPIPVPAGTPVERVRFSRTRQGGFSLRFGEGSPVRSFRFLPTDIPRYLRDPAAYGRALATATRNQAVRIRTGAGFFDPLLHGMSLPEAYAFLAETYSDSDEWLTGLEVLELGE